MVQMSIQDYHETAYLDTPRTYTRISDLDRGRIAADLATLFDSGHPREVMAIWLEPAKHIESHSTPDLDTALAFIDRAHNTGATGIYTGVNPITHTTPYPGRQRPNNRHVLHREALFLDLDVTAAKQEGRPATDTERQSALEAANHVLAILQAQGWTGPAQRSGSSGNGATVILALDALPIDAAHDAVLTAALTALATEVADRFPGIDLDTGAGKDPVRVRRINGTRNRGNGGDAPCTLDVHIDAPPVPLAVLAGIALNHRAPAVRAPGTAGASVLTLDDRDLIERISRERGGKGAQLLAGDRCGKPCYSTARGALGWKACFYTDDGEQIARILITSGLFKNGTSERERERQATLDAQKALGSYAGPRWTPASTTPDDEDPEPDPGPGGDRLRADLRRERKRRHAVERDRDMAIALLMNPNVVPSDKSAVVAALTLAMRGQPDPDGTVLIRSREIANDWRSDAKGTDGKREAPLNPDGSKYRMARGTVKKTMESLAARGFLDVGPQAHEVRPKGRDRWPETAWRVKRPTSLAEALAPIATFDPEAKKVRQPRTRPCTECGGIHSQTIQMTKRITCDGCGAVTETTSEKVVPPIIDIGPEEGSDKISDAPAAANSHRRGGAEKISDVLSVSTSTSNKISDPLAGPARPSIREEVDRRLASDPAPYMPPIDLADQLARYTLER